MWCCVKYYLLFLCSFKTVQRLSHLGAPHSPVEMLLVAFHCATAQLVQLLLADAVYDAMRKCTPLN